MTSPLSLTLPLLKDSIPSFFLKGIISAVGLFVILVISF
jgi:hypothetical protein